MKNAEVEVLSAPRPIVLLDLNYAHRPAENALPFRYGIGAPSLSMTHAIYTDCVEVLYGVKRVSHAAFNGAQRMHDGLTIFRTGGGAQQLHERAKLIQSVLATSGVALDIDPQVRQIENMPW